MTKTQLAVGTFHELLHLSSFQRSSMHKSKPPQYPEIYGIIHPERSGVSIAQNVDNVIERKKDEIYAYFFNLNEAITARMEKQFSDKMRNHPYFQDEFRVMADLLGKKSEKAHYLLKDVNEKGEVKYGMAYSYRKEQANMEELIKEIYIRNREEFGSEDEVFEVFAKAYFSGKLLPMAHLLEKTFGKGFFRKLGEKLGKKMSLKNDEASRNKLRN